LLANRRVSERDLRAVAAREHQAAFCRGLAAYATENATWVIHRMLGPLQLGSIGARGEDDIARARWAQQFVSADQWERVFATALQHDQPAEPARLELWPRSCATELRSSLRTAGQRPDAGV